MSLGPKSTTPDGDDSNLPLWRKHFPIGSNDEASRSRREFIGGLSVAGGAMACGQAALNLAFPSSQSAEEKAKTTKHPPLVLDKKLSELDDGEALLFHYPNEKSPCLLVKFSSDDVVAFAQKCTHLACPVIMVGTGARCSGVQLKEVRKAIGDCFVLLLKSLLKDWECSNPRVKAISLTESFVVDNFSLASSINFS